MGDPLVSIGDLHRARLNLHHVRKAQLAWSSLLDTVASEAVEYLIENAVTSA